MAINPETYSHMAGQLVSSAELVVLGIGEVLTAAWRRLIRDPDDQVVARHLVEAQAEVEAKRWAGAWRDWADDGLASAYLEGIGHAEAELDALRQTGHALRQAAGGISAATPLALPGQGGAPPAIPPQISRRFGGYPDHTTFYGVFRQAAYASLEGTDLQILRAARDEFRRAAIEAGSARYREADTYTRRQYSQDLLNRFADRGLQAITYRDGRRVSLDTYAEMVGRTQAGHAAVQASLNRFEEYGYDLVRVSAHFRACPVCVPWEGRVLSHSGRSPQYPSLATATAAGLFHANCAHDVSPYLPGLSGREEPLLHPAERSLVAEKGYAGAQQLAYEAQERQREIERHIRGWKRREVTALDDAARLKAKQEVGKWQKAQREHIADSPFLRRKYERESISRAR